MWHIRPVYLSPTSLLQTVMTMVGRVGECVTGRRPRSVWLSVRQTVHTPWPEYLSPSSVPQTPLSLTLSEPLLQSSVCRSGDNLLSDSVGFWKVFSIILTFSLLSYDICHFFPYLFICHIRGFSHTFVTFCYIFSHFGPVIVTSVKGPLSTSFSCWLAAEAAENFPSKKFTPKFWPFWIFGVIFGPEGKIFVPSYSPTSGL